MIHFRSWRAHNAGIIKDIEGKRGRRNGNVSAPITLYRVMVATNLDAHFSAFALAVGGRQAETFFVRCLQYAAAKSGRWGIIDVAPANFGTLVLSRDHDIVSPEDGASCRVALLSSGICLEGLPEGFDAGVTAGGTAGSPRAEPRWGNPTPTPSPSPTPRREQPPLRGVQGGTVSATELKTGLLAFAQSNSIAPEARGRARKALRALEAGTLDQAEVSKLWPMVLANKDSRIAALAAGRQG